MKRLLFTFLLFVSTALAQTPTQVKGFFGQANTKYQITLDHPTISGQAIVMQLYASGALWQTGPVCALAYQAFGTPFCDYNLTDSQMNQFVQVNRDYPGLLYVPASKGGIETITVSYAGPQNNNLSVIITVWPDTLVLQDVITPRCDWLPTGNQKQICDPWNSGFSFTGSEGVGSMASYSLVSSVPNELFIGWGSTGIVTPTFTATNGWATPMFGGGLFLSYKTSGPIGTSEMFTLTINPPLPDEKYVWAGIQGFKVIPIT